MSSVWLMVLGAQRPEVRCEEVSDGNFSPAMDAERVAKLHINFMAEL
jgi:hypothetical protein